MRLWEAWARNNGAMTLPASISDVCRFMNDLQHVGAEVIASELEALDSAMSEYLYAEVGRSRHVLAEYNKLFPDAATPPRGWGEDARAVFAAAPLSLRKSIIAREAERDRGLARAQNAVAEQRKAIERELAEQRRITNRLQKDKANAEAEEDRTAA